MGSSIELNDTLQITTEQGFPMILDLEKHRAKPFTIKDVRDKVFEFRDKAGARIYHHAPTRCFLVHNIDGKWLYWGKILMIEQSIKGNKDKITCGKYLITHIYDPDYQIQITKNESPDGKSYF